jgi:general secretion pathway protein D
MNRLHFLVLIFTLAASTTLAQTTSGTAPAPRPGQPPAPAVSQAPPPALGQSPAPPAAVVSLATSAPRSVMQVPPGPLPETADQLKFNFRNVPLDTVLNYLSSAAGFIIVREAPLDGVTVDILSHQTLDRDEAFTLLNDVLAQKKMAAIRSDRTLTIVTQEEARRRNIPVIMGRASEYDRIPPTETMVHQIIPVKYADVAQLMQNLQPLLPQYALISVNQGSNAIIITATQSDIRRMAQIINALDTSISEISKLKVYPLKHADAEEVARMINQIFQARQSTTRGADDRSQRTFRGGGPGGPGGDLAAMFGGGPGGPGGNQGGGQQTPQSAPSQARQAQALVVAVADTNTNSLVVSAPEEIVPIIDVLVKDIDTLSEDITAVRVFTLRYADATETADQINNVFDTTRQNRNSGGRGGRGGGFFNRGPMGFMGPGGMRGGAPNTERQVQEESIMAVADTRTNSVVVRAASTVMTSIEQMIKGLDSNPARNKQVYVYTLENADPEEVTTVIEGLFGGQSGSRSATTGRTSTRNSTSQSSRNSNSSRRNNNSGSGSSGRGSGGSGGGMGGGGNSGGGTGGNSGFGSLR